MIKKFACLLVFSLLMISSLPASDFVKNKTITKIDAHAVAIAVIYGMDEAEYNRRILTLDKWNNRYLAQIIFLGKNNAPIKYIAYIGAGTVLKNDYIITVGHLVKSQENILSMNIFVFRKHHMNYWEADIIAMTNGSESYNDYALLKTRTSMNLPGIEIAKKEALAGDKVIYVGSTNGAAFNRRFGFISHQKYFLYRGLDDSLHLGFWEDFEYIMLPNAAPGDSGGGIYDTNGKLVGIMYCGISAGHNPVFSNPIQYLWKFLKANKLEYIAK